MREGPVLPRVPAPSTGPGTQYSKGVTPKPGVPRAQMLLSLNTHWAQALPLKRKRRLPRPLGDPGYFSCMGVEGSLHSILLGSSRKAGGSLVSITIPGAAPSPPAGKAP